MNLLANILLFVLLKINLGKIEFLYEEWRDTFPANRAF